MMNFLPTQVTVLPDGTAEVDVAGLGRATIPATQCAGGARAGKGAVGIRPETLTIGREGAGRVAEGTVEEVVYYGDMTYYDVLLDGAAAPVTISMRNVFGRDVLCRGARTPVRWAPEAMVLFLPPRARPGPGRSARVGARPLLDGHQDRLQFGLGCGHAIAPAAERVVIGGLGHLHHRDTDLHAAKGDAGKERQHGRGKPAIGRPGDEPAKPRDIEPQDQGGKGHAQAHSDCAMDKKHPNQSRHCVILHCPGRKLGRMPRHDHPCPARPC
jgi:hypothetical protein